MTIATDYLDEESVVTPRRWNVTSIRNFMLAFGLLSSVFDYLTFGYLLLAMKADTITFRTCWFLESVCSATLIVLVIRTQRPISKSRPSRPLLYTTLAVILFTASLPFLPIAGRLGFASPPLHCLLALMSLVIAYIVSDETLKRRFLHAN